MTITSVTMGFYIVTCIESYRFKDPSALYLLTYGIVQFIGFFKYKLHNDFLQVFSDITAYSFLTFLYPFHVMSDIIHSLFY